MANPTHLLASIALAALAGPVLAQTAPATAAAAAAQSQNLDRAAFIATMDAEFRRNDANGDGRMTRAELAQFQRSRTIEAAQSANSALFDQLDANRDGAISRGEFAALVQDPGLPDVNGEISRMDANKDGVVTQVEFRGAALANFDKLDTDFDGVLTPAEMRAMETAPAK